MRDEERDLLAESRRRMDELIERSGAGGPFAYPPPVRTPVAALPLYGSLVVVCDDGSVHELEGTNWKPLAAVPGTLAERGTR